MEEFEPKPLTSGDMGKEPPRVSVGTAMFDDKQERVLKLIRQMDTEELKQLRAGYAALLGLRF